MPEALLPPRILSCEEWGALPPRHGSALRQPVGTVIHHTAGPNRTPWADPEAERVACFVLARRIQREHMARDPRIADSLQHFTIVRSGLILEGRRGSLKAAKMGRIIAGGHTGDPATNAVQWGLECEGRYDREDTMPDAQYAALVELCAWLSYWGGYQAASLTGHREHSSTACPGRLMDRLPGLRADVKALKLEIIASTGKVKP